VKDKEKTREQLYSELEVMRDRLKRLESASRNPLREESEPGEADLFTSRIHLIRILDTIGDPVFVKDRAHRFVFVNEAFCALIGKRKESFPGKTDFDFFPREQVDVFLQKDEEVFRTGQVNLNEESITDSSGDVRTIVTKKTVYIDDAGSPFIVGVIRDITDRRKAERELQKSEKKYRSIFENIQDVYYEVTVEGTILEVSPSILMVCDYARDELLGKDIFEYYSDPGARLSLIEQMRKTGWVIDHEIVLKSRDGSLVPCAITARLIRDEEYPKGRIVGIMRGIGQRKAMEAAVARETRVRRVLTDLSSRLISSYSLEDISDFVLDAAKGLTDSLFGFVGHIDHRNGHLVSPTMSRDVWAICNVEGKNFDFHEFKGLWGWVLNNRQPLLSNDPANDPRSIGVPAGHVAIDRFVSVPVMDGDRLMGQIALANSSRPYVEEDVSLLKRLGALFILALQRKWSDIEREKMIGDLQQALADVKKLSGLLPICANCKKVRNDLGYWEQIEVYIRDHSGADFSHGICPECAKELYPDINIVDKK
jgi:PAS domain S-box-containing protein